MKGNYSETLNLPKTSFPMRGNLPNREPEIQKWWDEIDIYQQVRNTRAGKKKFILHDGPPYANGEIHMGHSLNKILKDFIIRYQSLRGYDAPYVPGWDTHGLPIEHAIVTKKKVKRKEVDSVDFREMCKEYALNFVEKQKKQFQRLGIRGDWEHPYLTLQPEYEAAQVRLFGEMVKQGHIYRGKKSVYWSPTSETALAEAEIEYHEKKSPSIYVSFPVMDGKGILTEADSVVIWTTTPWTIPANMAIAVNKDLSYSLIRVGEQRLVVATELIEQVIKAIGLEAEEIQVLQSYQGRELEGVICQHPLYERESPIILGDHVTLDAGTGCVHTAPGHGEEDFYVGQKYGLDILCPVDEKGYLTSEAPGFEGIYYETANKHITEALTKKNRLLKLHFIKHQYAHDWRTKKPVIYRATEQWFASIDGFRQAMLDAIKNVDWTPHWGETRLHNMIADRNDWCISRQRIWGVPLPIFYCEECGEPHITKETIDYIANEFSRDGSTTWYQKSAAELLPKGEVCQKCQHDSFQKETDTMDVWFDSGSSHLAVLQQREELAYPADLYLEGSDQYRGWFNSSLSTSVATQGKAPYQAVLSHGFTLDGKGRKMSKSLGNVIEPKKVINMYGADILRLWVASVDYQADHPLSDEILKQVAEAYRKIRNTFRFLLGNLADYQHHEHQVDMDQWDELDQYSYVRLNQLIGQVRQAYDRYDFHQVYQSIHHYCTVFLSQFYFDICKDRLYTEPVNSRWRRSSQTVLYEILVTLVKLISPLLPHTAEEVWKHISEVKEESVELSIFPEEKTPLPFQATLEDKWKRLLALRDQVLRFLEEARANKVIGNSLGAKVIIRYPKSDSELFDQVDDLEQLFIVSNVELYALEEEQELQIQVVTADGEKCERCWIQSPTVGEHEVHTTLCHRCATIVDEMNED